MADYLGAAKRYAAMARGLLSVPPSTWRHQCLADAAIDVLRAYCSLAGLLYLVALGRARACSSCAGDGKAQRDGLPVYCGCDAGTKLWEADVKRYDRRGLVLGR